MVNRYDEKVTESPKKLLQTILESNQSIVEQINALRTELERQEQLLANRIQLTAKYIEDKGLIDEWIKNKELEKIKKLLQKYDTSGRGLALINYATTKRTIQLLSEAIELLQENEKITRPSLDKSLRKEK